MSADSASRQLADRFASEQAVLGPLSIGVASIAAVLAVLLCWLVVRSRQSPKMAIDHPWKLFRELTRAHRLSGSQERLLRRMIRQYEIEPPAKLMLEPERFQIAAADMNFASERRALLDLKERLFETR